MSGMQPAPQILPLEGREETRLAIWPGGADKGCLVYLNGLESNHSWFSPVALGLARTGVNVVAIDRRGTGINNGLKGGFSRWQEDVAATLEWIEARLPRLPVHLCSLCYGALLETAFALRHHRRLASLIYVAPGLKTLVHPAVGDLARSVLSRLAGHRRLVPSPIADERWFTAQPQAQEWIRSDPLHKREFTVFELFQTWLLRARILGRRRHGSVPVLVLLAENDRIIDKGKNVARLRRLFGDGIRVREYPGTTHCLFFEPGLDLAADIRSWMTESEGRRES